MNFEFHIPQDQFHPGTALHGREEHFHPLFNFDLLDFILFAFHQVLVFIPIIHLHF